MKKKYGLLVLLPLILGHPALNALFVARTTQAIEFPATPVSAPLIEDAATCCPQPLPTFCVPKPVKNARPCCPPPVCLPTRTTCPPAVPCLRPCRLGVPASCAPQLPCLRPRACRKKIYCCPEPIPCRAKPICCPRIRCCRPKPRCCPPVIPPCPPRPCITQPACPAVSQPVCPCDALGNSTAPVAPVKVVIAPTMADTRYAKEGLTPDQELSRDQAIDQQLSEI